MARERPIALRLKAFVREWVRAERSRGAYLADKIDRPQSWVTEYVEESATPRWADLDTAHAICEAIGVKLADFIDGPAVAQPAPLTAAQREAAEVAALWPHVDAEFRQTTLALLKFADTRKGLPGAAGSANTPSAPAQADTTAGRAPQRKRGR